MNDSYCLAILNENRFASGFAGMGASLLAANLGPPREIKVIVSSPAKISQNRVANFAKKVTKHLRISRGWSAFNVSVRPVESRQLPPLGTPQQVEGDVTAWIVE